MTQRANWVKMQNAHRECGYSSGMTVSCPNPHMALHLIPIGRALATKARLLRPGLHVPQRRAIKRLGLRILKLLDVLG
jgi:hypothetical protein